MLGSVVYALLLLTVLNCKPNHINFCVKLKPLLYLSLFSVERSQSCDIIVNLMSDDRILLVDRIIEDYHTCLKCVDNDGVINPETLWRVYNNGVQIPEENTLENLNGTLLLINSAVVIPENGRDVDIVANCYTPDQSLNRNVSLYSDGKYCTIHTAWKGQTPPWNV